MFSVTVMLIVASILILLFLCWLVLTIYSHVKKIPSPSSFSRSSRSSSPVGKYGFPESESRVDIEPQVELKRYL